MPTPLLPSLKENKVAIARRGEWISESQNTISDLVDDLKVAVNSKTDINSIPDIWARPAMYEAILGDESHHLHQKFVAEWRGILAIIALREARGLKNIKLEKFIVPDASELTGAEPKFEQVVAKLLPEKFKKFGMDQNSIMQIFTINNKPLAFVWPGLLLCPAVGLDKIIVNNISWWNDRDISDPTKFLSDAEKVLLKNWIGNAIKNLDVKENTLLGLLNSFREELAVDDTDTRIVFGNRIGVEGAYKFIDYPVMPVLSEKCIEDSVVKLVNQKGTNAKTLLVIVPGMDKQWDIAANKIVVAGTATFDAVANLCFGGQIFGENKKVINGIDIAQFNAELCSSEDFFTDKIGICYGTDNRFSNSLVSLPIRTDGADARVILPIKQNLLNYLYADWIAKNVSVEVKEQPDGQTGSDIEVKLKLPLAGAGSERLIEISKIYHRSSDEIKDYLHMPLVQIWPNFETAEPETWQAYYSFFDAPIGWQRKTFYVKPYWDNVTPRCIETNMTYAEIIIGNKFPEAYVCYSVKEEASGDKNDEIGLILLKKPQKVRRSTSTKECKIGIDFGTTNSVAYYAINEDAPEIIRFQNRLYSVIDSQADNKEELRRNFFSIKEQPDDNSTSIRSIFHSFIGNYDGEFNKPLIRGNIYYLEGSQTTAEDDGNVDDLHDDMKWNEQTGAYNMAGFLMQFAMQCMAEVIVKGATIIKWNYSYPSAFTMQQNNAMKQLWETQVLPCLHNISKLSVDEINSKTESVAMAEFFTKQMEAAIQRGIVCFDIGGGSTDIAIWQGSEKSGMRYQCSLRFAGRKILNNYLFNKKQNNNALLSLLRSNSDDYNGQLERVNNADISTFNMEIEALLKYYEQLIFNSLTIKSMNEAVSAILRDITFALAGIFYYTGTIITYLKNNDEYDEKVDLPNCYVGGNASKLLDWAGKGKYSDVVSNILIYSLISGMLAAGPKDEITEEAMTDRKPEVHKTNLPKQEVAYGLVCNSYITKDSGNISKDKSTKNFMINKLLKFKNSNISTETSKINDNIVAGEIFTINNQKVDRQIITKNDFVERNSIVKIDSNCPMFKDFVNTFNQLSKDLGYAEINFTASDYSVICDIVNQQLVDKHRSAVDKPETLEMEPLFIIILEKALENLSKR